MPLFDDMNSKNLAGSRFGYSGTRVGSLHHTEYTLVTIVADQSGSVHAFRKEIEDGLKAIVKACKRHPLADQVMLRTVAFNGSLHEVHGFRPITACDLATYDNALNCGGATALLDASHNALTATLDYGKTLAQHHLSVNGLIFVLTDGEDNQSTQTEASLQRVFEDSVKDEKLEGLHTILIGVQAANASQALMKLSAKVGFDDFINLQTADVETIAKLTRFATASIMGASIALSNGGSMPRLTF